MKRMLFNAALASALITGGLARAQIRLDEVYFNEFITFYVSSIDISSGASDVEIFQYELSSANNQPAWIELEFKVIITSQALGLTGDPNDPFIHMITEPFLLRAPLRIRNTDMSLSTDAIHDIEGNSVAFRVAESSTYFDNATDEEQADMMSIIVQSGRLPNGTYRFSLAVLNAFEDDNGTAGAALPASLLPPPIDRIIIADHPVSLELIAPGGPLADTTTNTISTSYPFFQWQSDPCAICGYRIRVAEYKADEHSSVEDAIEDQTVLPLNQALGFYDVETGGTSFQYPFTGAADLREGKLYAWQIQKLIPTTEGDEAINSFINVFKILDPTAINTGSDDGDPEAAAATNPILGFLQTAMGDELYSAVFGAGGDLEGFRPNDVISLNGSSADVSLLNDISGALEQGGVTLISVEVE